MSEINVTVPLPSDQKKRLQEALPARDDLEQITELIARAGALELLAQASGTHIFSSIADLRSFRIYCMLQAGMTLTEAETIVAAVFGLESRRAKSLVNATVARYRVELRAQVSEQIVALLEEAEWDREGKWVMRLPSMFVRDRVLDELERHDVPDPASAKRGSLWKMPDETYQTLRQIFALPENPPLNDDA